MAAESTMLRRRGLAGSLRNSIVLLCGLFAALFTILMAVAIMQARQRYLDQSMGAVEGLAGTYKAYTEKAVNEIDFSLQLVQGYARQLGTVGRPLMQAVGPALELRRHHTPYISNLMIADARGTVVSATVDAAATVGTKRASEREFFQVHRERADGGFHVGPIISSQVRAGELRFTLSRRLENARGEFLGVVVAFVDARKLGEDHARQLDDPSVSVTLMRIDGMVLTRTPWLQEQVGQVLPSFARYRGDPPWRSSFVIRSQIDQENRLIAQRRFDGMPMLIAVTQREQVTLQRWRASLPLALGLWALAVLAVVGFGGVVLYQQRWRERAQQELRRSLEVFNEAQRTAHVGSIDHDLVTGEARWSDEMFHLLEIDRGRGDLSVALRHERIHPDDRERVAHTCGQSRALNLAYQVSYRLQMPDGRTKWIREGCSYIRDDASRPLREVITLQDVTIAREAEEALARLRAQIAEHGAPPGRSSLAD
jgi:PAS domain-containing protein